MYFTVSFLLVNKRRKNTLAILIIIHNVARIFAVVEKYDFRSGGIFFRDRK